MFDSVPEYAPELLQINPNVTYSMFLIAFVCISVMSLCSSSSATAPRRTKFLFTRLGKATETDASMISVKGPPPTHSFTLSYLVSGKISDIVLHLYLLFFITFTLVAILEAISVTFVSVIVMHKVN